jgi:hypothetical protein
MISKFILLLALTTTTLTTGMIGYVALHAMLNNGLAQINFNRYNEGWLEVTIFLLATILSTYAILKLHLNKKF